MIHHDNGIDFAFIDADNIFRSMTDLAKRLGLDQAELDLLRFEYVVGNGSGGTYGWMPHTRRFVYYADLNGQTPSFLVSAEKSNGFILRNGQMTHKSGGKPAKQQGVDVLLAVEAMQHSFRKSMTHCTLYTSDGDFLPLVDELVANGTFVRIKTFNDPDQGNVVPSLRRSADSFERMDRWDLYRSIPDSYKMFGDDWSNIDTHEGENIERVTFHKKDAYISNTRSNFNLLFESGHEQRYRHVSFGCKEGCILFLKFGMHVIPSSEWKGYRVDQNYHL